MEPILCGLETEYGLQVEGVGAEGQIEAAAALVRSYSGERVSMWNYRYESPRKDLRGFELERLAQDPVDAAFDAVSQGPSDAANQVLANGARLYNDHGHPEFATPECNDCFQLALHDRVGEFAVQSSAQTYASSTGREVRIFKNNTDFHGASYGTHENYCVRREVGWEAVYRSLLPMLLFRPILCGAGKTGSESGGSCRFQMSQRADFFAEPINAETLYRRPIFNSRDEPHADARNWMRIHVIAGDANMSVASTARKTALAKLAIQLAASGRAPEWRFKDPVAVAREASRDLNGERVYALENGESVSAVRVLESYFDAAEEAGWLALADSIGPDRQEDPYLAPFSELFVVHECRELLAQWRQDPTSFARNVEWAAKRRLFEQFASETGGWDPVHMCALDLEFCDIDRSRSLFWALVEQDGFVDRDLDAEYVGRALTGNVTGTRSEIRSFAVSRFRTSLADVCWKSLVFELEGVRREVELRPDWRGHVDPSALSSVESFIAWIEDSK